MFSDKEKELLKILVEKELKDFGKTEDSIIHKSAAHIVGEVKYDEFLKVLLKKLE